MVNYFTFLESPWRHIKVGNVPGHQFYDRLPPGNNMTPQYRSVLTVGLGPDLDNYYTAVTFIVLLLDPASACKLIRKYPSIIDCGVTQSSVKCLQFDDGIIWLSVTSGHKIQRNVHF